MKSILTILICSILLTTVYQDFKERLVSVILFPLLLLFGLLWYFYVAFLGVEIFKNLLFLSVLLASAFVYISLKNRKITNILTAHLGLGDILFLIAITPFFSSQNFVLFLISGLFLSLLTHLLMLKFRPSDNQTVPLAGYLASYLFLLFIIEGTFFPNLFFKSLLN